jgi:hypothetical protein
MARFRGRSGWWPGPDPGRLGAARGRGTGLLDRSSAPKTVASTVSGILTDIGLGRLSRLGLPEPPNRYERKRPGELIHIDIKKLLRIEGEPVPDDRQANYSGQGRGLGVRPRLRRRRHPPCLRRCPPPTKGRKRVLPSCARRWSSTAATDQGRALDDRQTAALTARGSTRSPGSLSHKPPGARLGELKPNNLVGSCTLRLR